MPNYAKLCSQTICQTSLSTFIVNYALILFIKIMPYLCKIMLTPMFKPYAPMLLYAPYYSMNFSVFIII